ncbi:protein draper-like [Ylistrum balloti]|uniref:protein draper-like n=1 Tax=Ylistrum balloti TaxID=509963 RepID=UPI0029059DC4|nr:protein draper-like [Ylistrum balloti]
MMFLLVLLFLTSAAETELHGDNVCTFNNGTLRYRTIYKTVKVETKEPHCHAVATYGCARWEYYKNVSIPVNETYMESHLVQACCLGFQPINGICEVCKHGTFGWLCERKCNCPSNSTCYPKDGQCSCLPGLTGKNCDEECPMGLYGSNCSFSCDCLYSGDCHKDTGKCFPGPNQVNEHSQDTSSPRRASSIIYYIVIAVPAGFGLIIIILNIVLVYRCRLRKQVAERDCSQRGTREDYETIDDHFLSNDYVDMPHTGDTPEFKVVDFRFPDETYNEIHPEIHHVPQNGDQYTEVTCIIENRKEREYLISPQGDRSVPNNYDTMSRSWERKTSDSDDVDKENDYNRLEKDLKSYDTFQSVKEASSMTSLPAFLDDNYSNVNISEKGENLLSLKEESPPS